MRTTRSTRLEDPSIDLVFLDIQMPGGSGFDVLERLERVPLVVFTTAFDEYAVRAFEVNAFDYLMKPVRPERLASVLDKARSALIAASRQPARAARRIDRARVPARRRALLDRAVGRDRAVRGGRELRARLFRQQSAADSRVAQRARGAGSIPRSSFARAASTS